LNRKTALLSELDPGAANWGVIASLNQTCILNEFDPHAYLADTLKSIVTGHKQSQINDRLPWKHVKQVGATDHLASVPSSPRDTAQVSRRIDGFVPSRWPDEPPRTIRYGRFV